MHGVKFFALFKTGNNYEGICNHVGRILPAMTKSGGKEQAISWFEAERLLFNRIFQLPAQAENKFVS